MSAYEGTVLKAFGQAVIPLPDDIAYHLGMHFIISRSGDTMIIRPKITPEEALEINRSVADDLTAIWADMPGDHVEDREIIEAPDRPGLI